MKYYFTIIVFIFGLQFKNQAQVKAKFDNEKFIINKIAPSDFPILDNVITQSSVILLPEKLPVALGGLKSNFFNIDGFIKDNNDAGKLKIYVTVGSPKWVHKRRDNYRIQETPTQIGIYSSYYYEIDYTVELKYLNKTIEVDTFTTINSVTFRELTRIANIVKDFKFAESTPEYGDQIEKAVFDTFEQIQKVLNQKLKYKKTRFYTDFYFLTNTEHPEYEKMTAFKTEISKQLKNITSEVGLNKIELFPHLMYLESLLLKYPESKENTKIRYLALINLAKIHWLLEEPIQAINFAELLIKNDYRKSNGYNIIDLVNNGKFAEKKIRTHTQRFIELVKLGYKIEEEIEENRVAFFEKIEQDVIDNETQKNNRIATLENIHVERDNLLDSINTQKNPEILNNLIKSFGGATILKGIEKVHILSKLSFDDSNVPVYDEKWTSIFSNFLLKKKSPDLSYIVLNQADAWQHNDSHIGEKWKKVPASQYWNYTKNLDPIYLLSSFRIDLWNKYELEGEKIIQGKLCYHLNYTEKTLNVNNRFVPKTEYNLYIDKEKNYIVSSEKTEYEEGQKLYFERKIFSDYREIISLNSGAIPHKILVEIEDYQGQTFYQEEIEKVEINTGFNNRIFIKEVYSGGFK